MARRKKNKVKKIKFENRVLHPNAAGIDIGATEIWVAVPYDKEDNPIRKFQTFTEDIVLMAEWLYSCKIEHVAMESTGVYWIPVFEILEQHGFSVCLVNARHVKNVPGRKTDVLDCQWLQYLHSVGLLRGSFRPQQEICAIRSLWRHRENLIRMASSHVQHMHKSLTQMNLQIHNVISDITGKTGIAIIDAILAGERNPKKLAQHKDGRIRASKKVIEKSLVGTYQCEHVFTLKQALSSYRHYQNLIAEVDLHMEEMLTHIEPKMDMPSPEKLEKKRIQGNAPAFDSHALFYRIYGTDLTMVEGINTMTIHTLFSELGTDLSMFPRAGHFASWLNLCPNNKITGGRILSSSTGNGSNRVAKALRLAAQSVYRSQSYLGSYYRRMRARLGSPEAITATAHKLARILFHLITTGDAYDESHFSKIEEKHQAKHLKRLKRQAKMMGYELRELSNVQVAT